MRECGPCSACCDVLGVDALHKPQWKRCHLQLDGPQGCAAYEGRPASCQGYRCLWIDGELGDGDRPDLSGLIVDGASESFRLIWGGAAVNIREVSRGSSKTPRATTIIDRLIDDEGRPAFLKFYGGGARFICRSVDTARKFIRLCSRGENR